MENSTDGLKGGSYIAPRVRIFDIGARKVVCTSPLQSMGIMEMDNEMGDW